MHAAAGLLRGARLSHPTRAPDTSACPIRSFNSPTMVGLLSRRCSLRSNLTMLPIGAKSDGEHFRPEDTSIADAAKVPALAVFDLDACLWDQEMYTLGELVDANKPVMGQLGRAGEGVAGARSGQDVIRLHPGALYALQQIHDGAYPGMRAAVASSADTPLAELIGRSALDLLEVVPGVTVRKVLAIGWPEGFGENLQIGRQPPLSSNKARTHFPRLRSFTRIPYDRMLFFDDCNWGDHCAAVAQGCQELDSKLGPITVRTPRGLQKTDWENGLKLYAQRCEK